MRLRLCDDLFCYVSEGAIPQRSWFSPSSLAKHLRFKGSHLGEAAEMPLSLTELSCQESLDEIPGHFRTDRASTHAEDTHVIVLYALLGREVIVN